MSTEEKIAILEEAEPLQKQANEAFESGNYELSEELSEKLKELIINVPV